MIGVFHCALSKHLYSQRVMNWIPPKKPKLKVSKNGSNSSEDERTSVKPEISKVA